MKEVKYTPRNFISKVISLRRLQELIDSSEVSSNEAVSRFLRLNKLKLKPEDIFFVRIEKKGEKYNHLVYAERITISQESRHKMKSEIEIYLRDENYSLEELMRCAFVEGKLVGKSPY